MSAFDVFNGDADGICALHQLRLAEPRPEAVLITGVKRDNALLDRVHAQQARITVLDISLKRNRPALLRLLEAGCQIQYIDHHLAGEVPEQPALSTCIDASPTCCTSILVDRLLNHRYRPWAVVGAFGDNLHEAALRLGLEAGLTEDQLQLLKELGILLNYNGYGEQLDDLFYPPDTLYQEVHRYQDPFVFAAESTCLHRLRQGYAEDRQLADALEPIHTDGACRVFLLPKAGWAKRISGVLANQLARERADLAHALITHNSDQSYRISVRAPMDAPQGAGAFCHQYPDGGGRAAAAGINRLEPHALTAFIQAFSRHFSSH
jgi:hypothetical protein